MLMSELISRTGVRFPPAPPFRGLKRAFQAIYTPSGPLDSPSLGHDGGTIQGAPQLILSVDSRRSAARVVYSADRKHKDVTMIWKALAILAAFGLTACGGGSSNSIGMTAPAPASDTAPTMPVAREKVVAFMGDSITYLWNDPNWMAETDDLLSFHLPGVIDAGISGQTCDQMAARFQADVLDHHPDVVVLNCGTNDVFHLKSLATQADLFAMVQAAQSAGARVIVELCPPDAYVPGSAGWILHEQWNQGLRDGEKTYGYQLADYYTPMMLPDGTRNAALFAAGSAHPIAAGYAVMWQIIQPLITEQLN